MMQKKRCFRTCVSPTLGTCQAYSLRNGTSGRLVEEATGLNVRKYLAGHVGGVQQMGSQIEQNDLDLVIFLRDPEQPKQHEPDVHRIIRLCDVHSIPLATNLATAEMLIKSLDRGEMDWREIYRRND